MKDFNKGFTLGEILICLAIVGIIAALSLPKVITFKEKTIIGTSLGRTVLNLQNGFSNIIQRTQDMSNNDTPITTLDGIQLKDIFTEVPDGLNEEDYLIDNDYLFSQTSDMIGAVPATNYDTSKIRDYNGDNINFLSENTHAYRLSKLKSVVIFEEIIKPEEKPDNPPAAVANISDDGILARILIDANGVKEPNRLGKDIFLFGLANNGHLIPAGSEEYKSFDDSVDTDTCTENSQGTGAACAAKVMKDKWKIEY